MPEQGPKQRRKLAAILMADVSGFSRLMGDDEERTTARMKDFHRRVKGLIEAHDGRLVDTAGDSAFGEFDSVVNAVRCADQVQRNQAKLNADQPLDQRIDTRIGVHLGDVIVENYKVWGDGVNIAARLEQLAEPGGICVSEAVYQQIHNKVDVELVDMGPRELKNIQYPVRLYRIPPPGGSVPSAATPREVSRPRLRRHQRRRRGAAAARPKTWAAELLRTHVLLMLILGGALVLAPLYLFPTGGVLPTGGAALIGTSLGLAWQRLTGLKGHVLIPLGLGVGLGAAFTNWSSVTNGLFLLAGLTLLATGASRVYLERTHPRR